MSYKEPMFKLLKLELEFDSSQDYLVREKIELLEVNGFTFEETYLLIKNSLKKSS